MPTIHPSPQLCMVALDLTKRLKRGVLYYNLKGKFSRTLKHFFADFGNLQSVRFQGIFPLKLPICYNTNAPYKWEFGPSLIYIYIYSSRGIARSLPFMLFILLLVPIYLTKSTINMNKAYQNSI